MGLLDGMMDPESMATLQLAGGLLSPGSFGQGLSRGLTNYQATLTNAQDMAAKKQDMALQAAKLLSLQRNQDIVNGVLSRWNSPQGTDDQSFQFRAGQQALAMNQSAGLPAGPLASGAQPDQMPATTQPTIKQNGFPLSFRDVTALKMVGGPDLLKEWQIGNEGIEQKAGSFYKDPMTGQTRYVPDPTKGINFDPNTGRASVIPGASQAQADLAGATSGATEAAKAKYNFVDAYDPVTQRPIKVRADIVANSPGSSAPSAWIGSQPSNSDPLIGAVIQTESGGNQSAVSPKGAAGRMQLMPTTAHGLGVNASDPLENVAGGVSYLNQLRKKYGDDRTALVAYNWGPGNTDLWLKSGGDPAKLPPETRNYVSTVMQRAGTSTPPQTSMPAGALPAGPSADDAAGQAANKQFRVDLLTKAHASNADVLSKLQDTVRNEAELMNRNAQLVPLLDKFQTGGFSPESRIAFANSLQTSNLIPDSLKTKLDTWVANGDPTTGKGTRVKFEERSGRKHRIAIGSGTDLGVTGKA